MSTYQTLGSFPKLKHLFLTLDASDSTILEGVGEGEGKGGVEHTAPSDPYFNNFCQQFTYPFGPRYGHVRDVFIKSALDETLARSIFRAVTSGKPNGAISIEKLIVCIVDGYELGRVHSMAPEVRYFMSNLRDIVLHLSLPWLVTRNVRDDRRNDLQVQQLGSRKRRSRYVIDAILDSEAILHSILRYVWPSEPLAEGNHARQWHGFPLAPF